MRIFPILMLSVFLLSLSCERKSDSTTDTKATKTEVVKKEIDILNDSLNTAWKTMMAVDDQKLADMKRLLDEISYTSDYDVVLHDSLSKQLPILKSKRFNDSIDLAAMDTYDEMTDKYIFKLYQLKAKSREIEQHPLAETLVQDINKANSVETIVTLRKRYDNWAKAYNNYIKSHRSQLEKLGEPYASMKEKAEIIR